MINMFEVNETNKMIEQENLDVRTITMGISLLDCIDSDLDKVNEKIYKKITEYAKDLVETGDKIATEYGIPIVNKRISVTPIALVGGAACHTSQDFVTIAKTLDRAAKTVGVNFIGGYSALVSKGMTPAEELLDPFNPSGAGRDRACVQFCKRRFHKNRNQHGRSKAYGRDRAGNSAGNQGAGFPWLRESWWYSAMLRMTILSWQVLSTE